MAKRSRKPSKQEQVERGSRRVDIGPHEVRVTPSETFGGNTRSQPRRRTSGDSRFDKGFTAAYLATKAALRQATIPALPTDHTKDWVLSYPTTSSIITWEEKPKGLYDIVQGQAQLTSLAPVNHPTGALVYDSLRQQFFIRNSSARTGTRTDWTLLPQLSNPADTTILRSLDFDPTNSPMIAWEDARDRMVTVPNLAALYAIPQSHVNTGKLVYVSSERLIYEYQTTPALYSGTAADWTPLLGGLTFYARQSDLPTSHLVVGQEGIIRLDLAGSSYGRLVVYEGGTAGWRNVNVRNFIKVLRSTTDQATDMATGDLQFTMEPNHVEVKLYDGAAWREVLSEDTIKGWIASLSLFEGTVQEVGGGSAGAIDVSNLPALNVATTGHYYTWVGAPNYAVTATTPNIGADLDGAVLNPGDWLQQANRGTAAAPDMHWVVVGGDLLAKSRGDNLYGMQVWQDGNWENGSLVLYEGNLYRSVQGIVSGDSDPGTIVTGSVTGRASAEKHLTTQAQVGTAMTSNAVDGSNVGKWWIVDAGGAHTPTSGPLSGVAIGTGDAIMNLGDPTLGHQGWEVIHSPFPVGVPTFGPSPNKWSLVNVGGSSINFYTADANLPAQGSIGQLTLVLASARAQGKPALFTWDQATSQWSPLGGSESGTPIRDLQGLKLVNIGLPIGSVTAYGGTVIPEGWMICDGRTFDATVWTELSAALGGSTVVPDLRAQFIRGADPAHTAGGTAFHDPAYTQVPYGTGLPSKGFVAEYDGRHNHQYKSGWGSQAGIRGGDWGAGQIGWIAADSNTEPDGGHYHTLSGGDPETVPPYVVLTYIIKAGERAREVPSP